ncbi:MAG: 6-carboxytetrahydropterin synthase QueD, partial [Methylotenera sp.]
MQITTRLEFDAGHRIPCHKSQCKNLHGHRYAIEITLSGDIIKNEKASENGMVMDFSDVKAIAKSAVVDVWDHAFLVYQHDTEVLNFLNSLASHKTVIFPTVPTAENMAAEAFRILKSK